MFMELGPLKAETDQHGACGLGLSFGFVIMLCAFERFGISAVIMFALGILHLRLGLLEVSRNQVGACYAPPTQVPKEKLESGV